MKESKARQHFLRIPSGHTHPLQRPTDSYTDRAFREMVESANHNGDCIINVGSGYYRPLPGDDTDEKELREYLTKELTRARRILAKRLAMRSAFEKRREVEVFTNHTRKT